MLHRRTSRRLRSQYGCVGVETGMTAERACRKCCADDQRHVRTKIIGECRHDRQHDDKHAPVRASHKRHQPHRYKNDRGQRLWCEQWLHRANDISGQTEYIIHIFKNKGGNQHAERLDHGFEAIDDRIESIMHAHDSSRDDKDHRAA